MYIHEHDNWTDFRWDNARIATSLDEVARAQGRLYGKLSGLGFDSQLGAMAENLTRDLIHSSEIEGVRLNASEVRSSIARRLGIDSKDSVPSSHYVDGVVAAMLDATDHYDQPLDKNRLCAWQAAFFPTGYSGGSPIEVGRYRTNDEHIVSGYLGRERVHYVAPSPDRVEAEMQRFISWFNSEQPVSFTVRSAIAHLWFVSIHPFEDGNGRLARILGDMMLSRGDKSRLRFYNISSEINRDKRHYYEVLERTQRGDGDITEWLEWYVATLSAALAEADSLVSSVLNKSRFWLRASSATLNQRQTATLNIFLDGYEAKLTTKTWAVLNKCSRDTAARDIQDLVAKRLLSEDIPGAKRPSYSIIYSDNDACMAAFDNIRIEESGGHHYLCALRKDGEPVRERILRLDAERYQRGDLQLASLLAKYCTHLV
jgi:Fic family protein